LDSIGFWWSSLVDDFSHSTEPVLELQWNSMFQQLADFKDREGHLNVPPDHKLHGWICRQRKANRKNELSEDRKQKLDDMGFRWVDILPSYREDRWSKMYEELKAFQSHNGHCQVPASTNEALARWVHRQRARRNDYEYMSVDRRERLGAIGFRWVIGKGKYDRKKSEAWQSQIGKKRRKASPVDDSASRVLVDDPSDDDENVLVDSDDDIVAPDMRERGIQPQKAKKRSSSREVRQPVAVLRGVSEDAGIPARKKQKKLSQKANNLSKSQEDEKLRKSVRVASVAPIDSEDNVVDAKEDMERTTKKRSRAKKRRKSTHNANCGLVSKEEEKLRRSVAVYFTDDDTYYRGVLSKVSKRERVFVEFDDGDSGWVPEYDVIYLKRSEPLPPRKISPPIETLTIGSRITVWWPNEREYFDATIVDIQKDREQSHSLMYDDGDEEWTSLLGRKFKIA